MSRWQAAWSAFALEGRARTAEQREQHALGGAGAAVFEALRGESGGAGQAAPVRDLCERLTRIDTQTTNFRAALERSLAKDRDEFARATQAMRWVVVARGALDRVLLRGDMRRETRERPSLERELGRLAIDGSRRELSMLVPERAALDIASARADAAAARSERTQLLAPYGGEPLPGWLATAWHEARVFLEFVWDQLSKRFFLRAPALVGLLVGWWLGRQFSDSAAANWVHEHIGFDIRDRNEVEAKARLAFWLPLLAAACCSYIASFVALRVQRKYALPDAGDAPQKAKSA